MDGVRSGASVRDVYGYAAGWGVPGPALRDELVALMAGIGAAEQEGSPTRSEQRPVRTEGRGSNMP